MTNSTETISPPETLPHKDRGWRRARVTPSLAEVYRSFPVTGATWWRSLLARAGPRYLVAVGDMGPADRAPDLVGASQLGYKLRTLSRACNLMAIVPQGLSPKLGLVAGRDLAQACRENYPK